MCIKTIEVYITSVCSLQKENDRTILRDVRRVACVEMFEEILQQVHCKDSLHAGYQKTYARVSF